MSAWKHTRALLALPCLVIVVGPTLILLYARSIDTRWPDDALPEIGLDARTAFIALTHDPKIDDPALKIALESDVFYIGALGSNRTHAKRIDRLVADGVSEEALARINAPIGLDIGAVGPAEIAISVIAEVTAALRGKVPKDQ